MRLVHQTVLRARGYAVYYFQVYYIQDNGLGVWRPPSDEEISRLQLWQPRMQRMCDTVMGQDVGRVTAEIVLGDNCLYLQIPEDFATSSETISLIGWIELFGLEPPPSPRQPADYSTLGLSRFT